eukprot:scaffold42163_cov23-Cyclotella_meneghiniana.AAC.1
MLQIQSSKSSAGTHHILRIRPLHLGIKRRVLEEDDKNCPSKYTNKMQILQRLSKCQQPWHSYFETPEGEDELESDSLEEVRSEEGSRSGSESESESGV